MRRLIWGLWTVLAVLAAGCSGSHRAAPPTSSATGIDPDVVPAVITPEYVNAVFVVLNRINGDALRALISAKAVTSGVETDLKAIYAPPLLATEESNAAVQLAQGISDDTDITGDRVTTVQHLISGNARCIFAETVTRPQRAGGFGTPLAASEYWRLRRKVTDADPENLNSTPWMLDYNRDFVSQTKVRSQC